MKAVDANLEIPALDFVIGADQKRHIDSLYNHIVMARDNLENHCGTLGESSEERAKILRIVESLTALLDVDEPFELVVHDPSALSEFKPTDAVRME